MSFWSIEEDGPMEIEFLDSLGQNPSPERTEAPWSWTQVLQYCQFRCFGADWLSSCQSSRFEKCHDLFCWKGQRLHPGPWCYAEPSDAGERLTSLGWFQHPKDLGLGQHVLFCKPGCCVLLLVVHSKCVYTRGVIQMMCTIDMINGGDPDSE